MKKTICLFFIVILCAILYIYGIKWGLPSEEIRNFCVQDTNVSEEYVKHSWEISKKNLPEKQARSSFNAIRSFHPDEQNILKSISGMSPEKFDFNPHFFEYPSCQIYIVAVALKILSSAGLIKLKPDVSYYFKHPEEIAKMYLTGRIITVLMAVLGLFLFYKTAGVLCGKYGADFATACLGLCPLYVLNSHYMTVDISMVFWIIFSLFYIAMFVQKRKFSYIAASAFVLGIATGTKYPAGILIFLLPFVYYGIYKKSIGIFTRDMAILFLLFFAGFLITTPYCIIAFDEFKRDVLYQTSARGIGPAGISSYINSFINFFAAIWIGSYTLLFLFVLSIYFLAKRRIFEDRIILTGLVLAIAPLFIAGGFKYARYYLPLFPFLCLAVGSFFNEISRIEKKKIKVCVILLCILTMVPVLVKSVLYSKLMSQKDIRIVAAEYIHNNIPEKTRIVFTKDPWIFEVPPVNPLKYEIMVQKNLDKVPGKSFLIVGELQYFLTCGNRNRQMQNIIEFCQKKGFRLEKIFENEIGFGRFRFDCHWTLHDMIYTHPKIFLFYKP